MFPVAPQRDAEADVLAMAGMDILELVSRLQRSDLDQATLDSLRIMPDRLCSEYPYMPADQLLIEGRAWLRRITALQGQRVTLKQHREILVQAGWVALLVGCVEYDTGNRQAAETTRQAALSLGTEADHGEIIAWAHEMRAWINLTTGDYHGVVTAARAGTEPGRAGPARLPATYHRTHGIRYFHGCYSLGDDRLWGVTRLRKGGDHTLAALKSIRAARPDGAPIYVICDNLSANKTPPIRAWAKNHKVHLCFTPTSASWANPIEAQFGPLRTFVMGGSDHPNHTVLTRRLQDYLTWRNANARHPDVLAAQRRERARVRSELHQRWGRPRPRAA